MIPVLAQIVGPETDLAGFLQQLFVALQGKNWWLAGVLVVIGVVAALRYAAGKFAFAKFLVSDRWSAVLALVAGVAGSLLTAVTTTGITPETFLNGVVLGVTAAGGYTVVKRIAFPSDAPPAPVVVDPPAPPVV